MGRLVGTADGVPRPAKPARQTWTDLKRRDDPLPPPAKPRSLMMAPPESLPRRLRRPRQDLRLGYPTPHPRLRPAPRQGLGAH